MKEKVYYIKKTVYYCAFHNIQESKMLQVLYKTY